MKWLIRVYSKLRFYLQKICNEIFFREVVKEKDFLFFHPAPRHRERWIFSLYDYKDRRVKKMIRYLKNHQDKHLISKISSLMGAYIMDYLSGEQELSYFYEAIVIPVPLSKKQKRKRGFNQVNLLAKNLAVLVDGKFSPHVVKKREGRKKQALIESRKERFENAKGAYFIDKDKKDFIRGKDVIIVDDLSTTGATLMEIKKVLKKSGARKVIGLTIAH